jgi:hypothetical protein
MEALYEARAGRPHTCSRCRFTMLSCGRRRAARRSITHRSTTTQRALAVQASRQPSSLSHRWSSPRSHAGSTPAGFQSAAPPPPPRLCLARSEAGTEPAPPRSLNRTLPRWAVLSHALRAPPRRAPPTRKTRERCRRVQSTPPSLIHRRAAATDQSRNNLWLMSRWESHRKGSRPAPGGIGR